MIDGRTVSLTALIGLFSAGAAVCAFGLLRTLAGWPVSVADLLLFAFVMCAITGAGWRRLMDAEYQRERLWLSGEELRQVRLVAVPETEYVPDEPSQSAVYAQHWRVAAHRFVMAGDRYGFAIRKLVTAYHVVTWDGWGLMVMVLQDAGVLVVKPAAGWAPDWDLPRWNAERHSLSLPCPNHEPPAVELTPNAQHNNGKQQVAA